MFNNICQYFYYALTYFEVESNVAGSISAHVPLALRKTFVTLTHVLFSLTYMSGPDLVTTMT